MSKKEKINSQHIRECIACINENAKYIEDWMSAEKHKEFSLNFVAFLVMIDDAEQDNATIYELDLKKIQGNACERITLKKEQDLLRQNNFLDFLKDRNFVFDGEKDSVKYCKCEKFRSCDNVRIVIINNDVKYVLDKKEQTLNVIQIKPILNSFLIRYLVDLVKDNRKADDAGLYSMFHSAVDEYLNKIFDHKLPIVKRLVLEMYERKKSCGKMIIASEKKDVKFEFEGDKINFNNVNIRYARKLLELTKGDKYALIIVEGQIIGLSEISGYYESKAIAYIENGFQVTLSEEADETLQFINNEYRFKPNRNAVIRTRIEEIKNSKKVEDILDPAKVDAFYGILQKVIENNSGALLIISTRAAKEVNRLVKTGRGIAFAGKPIDLGSDFELLTMFSSIDGAVLFDQNLQCYGMGIILDGIADDCKGNIARGSRYNSACTYIEYITKFYLKEVDAKHVALVLSEDGGVVDIFPRT